MSETDTLEAEVSHDAHHDDHHHEMTFLEKYIFPLDHKVIAYQYMITGVIMGLIGGYFAYVFRMQLAFPGEHVPGFGLVSPAEYNALVTNHGTIMIFWVAMPVLIAGFGNFLIPLMIGCDDMVFPKINRLSYQIFLRENVGKEAALVDAVLAYHVANTSLSAPAPWLSSFVGPALASSPDEVQAVLEQWRKKSASCVDLYEDASFTALVEVVRQATGWQVQSLRRGVLSRDDAGGRRLWTLRMTLDGRERLLALAPEQDEDSSQERERKRVTRIHELCASALVVAPGEGNAKLRAAAAKLGLQVCEQELSAEELVQRLAALEGVERSKRGERGREERKDKASSSRSEPSDESQQAAKDLQAHLLLPQWDKQQLVTIVCKLHRVREAFRALRAAGEQEPASLTDEKLDTFLAALEEGAPPEVRLSEGTSLGILMASTTGPDGQVYKRLVERPEGRLSGPGVEQVIALSAAATAAGCEVRRVLRGSTVKERRKHSQLDEHDGHTQGLWRLLVSRGSARGELWFIDNLAEQGRGAAALLADFSRNFVIARAADEQALSWLDDTLAQRVIAWTPGDSAALDVAVGGWGAE